MIPLCMDLRKMTMTMESHITNFSKDLGKPCKFNPDKLSLRTSEIPFFELIILKDRIKPGHKKIEVITLMKPP